jgi:hypothetical protein
MMRYRMAPEPISISGQDKAAEASYYAGGLVYLANRPRRKLIERPIGPSN